MATAHHATRHARRHRKLAAKPAAPPPSDKSARVYWVAGLAGLGILLIAGIASAASSKPSPRPSPPGPAPLPTSQPPVTPLQVAAAQMAQAIAQNGYRLSDQALYRSFQSAAGLKADGFPGTNTMNALGAALGQLGMTLSQLTDGYTNAPVVVYPWLTTCSTGTGDQCYNGTDAPTFAEWSR